SSKTTHRTRITLSYKTTTAAYKPRRIRMVRHCVSFLCPCLAILDLQPHVCRPAMRIFTLPMALSWFPSTTIPMISKHWRFCKTASQSAGCLASPVSPWSGAWALFTVSHSSNQPLPPPDDDKERGRRVYHDCTTYQ